jgi:hypothetical protein
MHRFWAAPPAHTASFMGLYRWDPVNRVPFDLQFHIIFAFCEYVLFAWCCFALFSFKFEQSLKSVEKYVKNLKYISNMNKIWNLDFFQNCKKLKSKQILTHELNFKSHEHSSKFMINFLKTMNIF